MKLGARRRPRSNEAFVKLPELFARQNTDCSGGSQFYRCSLNNFAGCCSVDPCSMEDGCPDDEDEDEDEQDEDETTTTTTTTAEETTTTTSDPGTQETVVTVITRSNDEGDLETSVITTVDGAVIPTDLPDSEGSGDDGDDDDSGGGLGGGAIAGIVVGVLAFFLILAALFVWRRRKQKKRTPTEAAYPPPMDANDEKFLGAADPASATTPSASTTPAAVFGKLGLGSRAPTPSTPGQSSVGGNAAMRHSYVSSMTSGSPPPGLGSFTPAISGAAEMDSTPGVPQLDSSPVIVAEMDGAGVERARPPSELPATPIGTTAAPKGPGVHHGREASGGALPTVAENEAPRATLNDTGGRTYVNSWSSYEAVQRPPAQEAQGAQGSQEGR